MMPRILFSLLMCAISAKAQQASTRDLNILTGVWDIEEVHASGWSEKGVRSCYYIMDSTYIECETKAVSNNKQRTYRFLINYNQQDRRFEMVGFYSNWPLKQFDMLIPESSGMQFRVVHSPAMPGDTQREGTISFSNRDTYVWSGKNSNPKKGTTTVYKETGIRRSEP